VIRRALGWLVLTGAIGLTDCASRDPAPAKVGTAKPGPDDKASSDQPSEEECLGFTGKVNQTLRTVVELTQKQSQNDAELIDDMEQLAKAYDQLAVDIGAMDFKSATLEKYATEYREMCAKAASSARQVGNAIRTKNVKQAETAEKDFGKIVKQEDELVDRINRLCRVDQSVAS
jgi:hypothetical protein